MPLPSQAPRPGQSGPRFTGGRSRRRANNAAKRVFGILLLAGLIGGGYYLLSRETPEPASANSTPNTIASSEPDRERTLPRINPPTIPQRGPNAGPVVRPRPATGNADRSSPIRTSTEPSTPTGANTNPITNTTGTTPTRRESPPSRTTRQTTPSVEAEKAPPPPKSQAATLIEQGEDELARNRPLRARETFNRALHHTSASEVDRAAAREQLSMIAQEILFSPQMVPGDPLVISYEVKPGDALSLIPRSVNARTEWQFIQRINRIDNPSRIRPGQTLKVVQGPFHAVIDKSEFRLDLYADAFDPDGNRLFIRSFDVGLGEYGSTPIGTWTVRTNSKLIDPSWTNPRSGERFDAADPDNPIGEHWIGLEGTDEQTSLMTGYGIHGTIEPESIGDEASMGCVRLRKNDVELLYELLMPEHSTVAIVE